MEMFHWTNGRMCSKCGKPMQEDYPHDVCTDCRDAGHFFEKGYSCVQYGLYEKELVLSLKYGGKAYIGKIIGKIMADRLEVEEYIPDVIVAVPMHRKKERKRGYNQAEIIAAELAKLLGIPFKSGLLVRKANTLAMSRLAPEERRMNIENTIMASPKGAAGIHEKNILLVDDIYTTGSTASECARALLEAGGAEVRVITFAAGANIIRWDKGAAQVCG